MEEADENKLENVADGRELHNSYLVCKTVEGEESNTLICENFLHRQGGLFAVPSTTGV